jgi:hypothetical protein
MMNEIDTKMNAEERGDEDLKWVRLGCREWLL